MQKGISIIMVTYNRPKTLLSVIDTYILQKDICELIVVDDGSTKQYDSFNEYCRTKCGELGIEYIYVKNDRNYGAAFSRKVGVDYAQGEFIFWGEDDLYLEDKYIENLRPYVTSKSAAFGSIFYDMDMHYTLEEKSNCIMHQQNRNIPLMDWNTLEGYFRLKKDEIESVLFGHAVYLVKTEIMKKISVFNGYKVNGFREETDIQLQLRFEGIDFLYVSEAKCYHLKNRIGDENKGGQHKDSRLRQELFYIINNNIFINRNYEIIKYYNPKLTSKTRLKINFIKKRMRFNLTLVARKIVRRGEK